jgi:hypothetical protein
VMCFLTERADVVIYVKLEGGCVNVLQIAKN